MALDPNTLYQEANCYLCLGISQAQALELALLRRQLLALVPDADTSVDTLLQYGSCYRCYSNGDIFTILKLALLDQIAQNQGAGGSGVDLFTYDSVDGTAFSSTLLTEFTGDFWITGASGSSLTSVSFPNLTTVGGFFDLDNHADLATLNLPSLETVGGGLYLIDNDSITGYALVSLESIGVEVSINGNALITSIDLGGLSVVSGILGSIDNNDSLTQIDLTSLISVTGDTAIHDNSALDTIVIPAWIPTNGTTNSFTNNALLQASVDQILARHVANAGYVTGQIDLSGGTNAPPGVQGAADVITLTGRGVTVITN